MDINARSVEDALRHYDYRSEQKNFKPFYCVKAVNQIKFSNTEDDINLGREKLEMNLMAAKQVGNTSTFSICFYNKLDKNGECTGTPEVFNVKLNDPNQFNASVPSHQNLFGDISRSLENINIRLNELESDPEDEDEDEENDGLLGGITKDPDFKKMILSMFINGMTGQNKSNINVNGIPTDSIDDKEKIKLALNIMAKHTESLADDLTKLASIASTDPNKFTMLLNMLRSF
tara:strand:+ start:224 stop:919 length:696 start_codon:yes stop_codon:yes gene_type:complete